MLLSQTSFSHFPLTLWYFCVDSIHCKERPTFQDVRDLWGHCKQISGDTTGSWGLLSRAQVFWWLLQDDLQWLFRILLEKTRLLVYSWWGVKAFDNSIGTWRRCIFLSLWIKSWQPLEVYFKQSQWFLERWKTREGHSEKQAENLTAGQQETKVIKSTASSSSSSCYSSRAKPLALHTTTPGFLTIVLKTPELFSAELPSPWLWPVLPRLCAQVVLVTGDGCHSRKMGAWDTNSNAEAWSIAIALVTKTKISYLQRM